MSTRTPGIRRAVVGALAALLAIAALVPLATGAGALANFTFTRLAGENRFETAAAIATNTYGTTARTALIARADEFPDALAGNYLAGLLDAPILLVRTNEITTPTVAALQTLRTKNVVILGREEAVSAAVATQLAAQTSTAPEGGTLVVSRVGGQDRYETANLIARGGVTTGGTPLASPTVGVVQGRRTGVVARGDAFPDALAVGPASFARNLPILLTPGAPSTTLHGQAAAGITTLTLEHVLVLGGEEAVTPQVEVQIQNARGGNPAVITTRLAGGVRTETARAIAEFSLQRLGFTNVHVNMARGDQFPDSLTGGPHAGRERAPILLTASPTLLSQTPDQGAARYLSDHCPTLQSGHIYGGVEAVTPLVQAEGEQRGRACGAAFGNQSFQVNPANAAFLQTGQTRQCTAFVTPGAVVDIQLFQSQNVNIAANGQVTFANAGGTATTGNPAAQITVTSPATTPTANVANNITAPANGIIAFTVTSSTPGTDVTAVVFADPAPPAGNNQLNVDATGAPTEAFGIGCQTFFQADVVAPVITDARILIETPTVGGVTGTVSAGDQWRLTFSEPLAPTADDPGQSLTITDLNGDSFPLTCVAPGGAAFRNPATCQLAAGNTQLVITIEEPVFGFQPLGCGPGFNAGPMGPPCIPDYPVDVVDLGSGVADPAGNQVNLAGSPDRRIDQE